MKKYAILIGILSIFAFSLAGNALAIMDQLTPASIDEAVKRGASYKDKGPKAFMDDLCGHQEKKAEFYEASVVVWTKYNIIAFDSMTAARGYEGFNPKRLIQSEGYKLLEKAFLVYVVIHSEYASHLDDFRAVIKQGDDKVVMPTVAELVSFTEDVGPDEINVAVYHWAFPLKGMKLDEEADFVLIPLMGEEKIFQLDLSNIK